MLEILRVSTKNIVSDISDLNKQTPNLCNHKIDSVYNENFQLLTKFILNRILALIAQI